MILPERDFLDSLQGNGAAYEGLLRPSPVLSEVDGGVHGPSRTEVRSEWKVETSHVGSGPQ